MTPNLRKCACGFSLLELLITILVLSIGLLGIGLMQTTNLGGAKTAYSRTQAMLLAADIADRIRANESAAANYIGTSATGTPGCISGSACLPAAIAASDLADWSNRLAAELPSGTGKILDASQTPDACTGYSPTAVPSGLMRVLIKWGEAASAASSNTTGDCYQFDFVF